MANDLRSLLCVNTFRVVRNVDTVAEATGMLMSDVGGSSFVCAYPISSLIRSVLDPVAGR